MKGRIAAVVLAMVFGGSGHAADDEHRSHPAPEKLGAVTFSTSCAPAVKPAFERAIALLHSFAYTASEQAFRHVSALDLGCAIAHWGIAMSRFHQLWDPPLSGEDLHEGAKQLQTAVSSWVNCLLLNLKRPGEALREFRTALKFAPGRRGALGGAMRAAELLGDADAARQFRSELSH